MATPYKPTLSTPPIGIGQGLAQVIDTSTTDRMLEQRRAQEFAEQQAGAKAKATKQAKREEELMKLMAKSRGAKLKTGDMPYFKGKQEELNQMMRDALDDNEINNEEYMKIIGAANQINAEAEMAGAQKLALEKTMGAYDPRIHRPEQLEEAKLAYERQGQWGQQFNLIENISVFDRYQTLRLQSAKRLGEVSAKGDRRVTLDVAKDLLANELMGDTEMMDQVKYDMGQVEGAKKAYGDISDAEAIQFIQDKYAEDMVRKAPPPRPRAADKPSAAAIARNPNVTFTKEGDSNVLTTATGVVGEESMVSKAVTLPKTDTKGVELKDETGKSLTGTYNVRQPTIYYDDFGDIEKITAVRQLSNTEKSKNKVIEADNKAARKTFREDLVKYNKKLKLRESDDATDEDLDFIDDFDEKYGTDLDNPSIIDIVGLNFSSNSDNSF